jgi:hypothetical protein
MMTALGRRRRAREGAPFGLTYPLAVAALVLSSLSSPGGACAAEGAVRGAIRAEGLANSDLGESVFDGRLDFEAETGRFILGGTFRAYEMSDRAYNPRQVYGDALGFKHRYAEFNAEDMRIRAGDCFVTFGKGLTLRSFEEIDLEHDTALDGVLGEYRVGAMEVTGVAGGMTDRISSVQEWQHNVYGMRATASFWDFLKLGTTGLKRFQRRHDQGVSLPRRLADFDDIVMGSDAEAWVGPVTVGAEYVERAGDYYYESEQDGDPGHGFYAGGSYGGSRLSVLGEYKDYYRFENALVNPPTCVEEHLWVLMNRVTHVVDLNDEKGWIMEGVLTLPRDMTVTGGASEARLHNDDLSHWEIFGQIDYISSGRVSASSALSWSREYESGAYTEYFSAALDSDISLSEQVIEFTFETQHTEDPAGLDYGDFLAAVAYYPRYYMTVVGQVEHTGRSGLGRDTWVFVDLRLTIAEGYEVALGGGAERGGKKCAGGICYNEPEFAGIKLRFLTYF